MSACNKTFAPYGDGNVNNSHIFNPDLLNLLKEHYTKKGAKTVADLGCGNCDYVEHLRN
jgi:hypothetical protein